MKLLLLTEKSRLSARFPSTRVRHSRISLYLFLYCTYIFCRLSCLRVGIQVNQVCLLLIEKNVWAAHLRWNWRLKKNKFRYLRHSNVSSIFRRLSSLFTHSCYSCTFCRYNSQFRSISAKCTLFHLERSHFLRFFLLSFLVFQYSRRLWGYSSKWWF